MESGRKKRIFRWAAQRMSAEERLQVGHPEITVHFRHARTRKEVPMVSLGKGCKYVSVETIQLQRNRCQS